MKLTSNRPLYMGTIVNLVLKRSILFCPCSLNFTVLAETEPLNIYCFSWLCVKSDPLVINTITVRHSDFILLRNDFEISKNTLVQKLHFYYYDIVF